MKSCEVDLHLSATDLDDEGIQYLTHEFAQSLQTETGISVVLPTLPEAKGFKGDPITVGNMLVTLIGTQGVLAFINVIRTYFERKSSIQIEVTDATGKRVVLGAQNLTPSQVQDTKRLLEDMIKS